MTNKRIPVKEWTIPFPAHFSFRECHWFLDRNYDDCLHRFKDNQIRKLIRVGQELWLIGLEEEGRYLKVTLLYREAEGGALSKNSVTYIKNYISNWLDLDRDLSPFYRLLKKDPVLAYMTKAFHGLRLVGIVDLWEALCWSIIGQQINLRFAYTLKRRLVEKWSSSIVYDQETYYLFPNPHSLKDLQVDDLRALQFSRSKASYLIGMAQLFAGGELSREVMDALPDLESRQKKLMQYKGVGIWTANYTLMKTLREPSCIPHGDTGLLTALANHGIISHRSQTAEIDRFFARFKGWESYIVFYLWRSLAVIS